MHKIIILVSYQDRHKIIKSDILVPIQTGRVNADEVFEEMIGDDTGDNISDKNHMYNELSAQYWAWKNYAALGNPDYIGFMHYRRHFMFDDWKGNEESVWLPSGPVYHVPWIDNDYYRHIEDSLIKKQLQDCDCIVIKPYDVKNLNSKSCREQFGQLAKQNIEDFDEFIRIAKKNST